MSDFTSSDVGIQTFKGEKYWSVAHDSISDILYDADGNFVGLLLNRQGRLTLHKDQDELGAQVPQNIPTNILQELGPLE